MTAKFGEWAPDIANVDNSNVSAVVKNVLPGLASFRPMPNLSAFAAVPLAANCTGLAQAKSTGGTWQIWAGTGTKLYKFATSSWTDVSRLVGGAYTSTNFWRFAQFGTNLIAVNGVDVAQAIDVDSGANFAALAGSPPVAKNVSVVGDFVVMSALASTPYKVKWSAINDSTGWTVGTSLSDEQSFADGGVVTGVAGGEVGYVLQEYAIRRMRFLPGSDYVFTFERVVDGKGCISPYGYVSVAGTIYFICEDGFYSYSGQGLNPIGSQRVNEWFLANSDPARLNLVYCVADPLRPRIFWAYYSNSAATTFDRIMVYDWQLNQWSYGEVAAQMWSAAASPGVGLDSIATAPDSLTVSLDSRTFQGGRPTICAIDTSKNVSFLEGAPLAATIETMEFHPDQDGGDVSRGVVTSVYPLTDASAALVRIGTREKYSSPVVYTLQNDLDATGKISVRASGRLFRAELYIPAGSAWTNAIGIDFDMKPAGKR